MSYQKTIFDATTGTTTVVDLTPEEVTEIEAKKTASGLLQAAEAAEQEAIANTVAGLPTPANINSAKDIAELKALMLKQNAVIALLVTRAGLGG